MTIRSSRKDCVSVADRLDTLDQIKRDILAAIASKGVPFNKWDSMLTYADKIRSISGFMELYDVSVSALDIQATKTLTHKQVSDPTVGVPADSIRYVTPSGAGNGSGTSWANAASGLTAWNTKMVLVTSGIPIEWANKIVLFAPGTYDLHLMNERVIAAGVNMRVYGGVVNNGTTTQWSARDTTNPAKQTIFDFSGRSYGSGLYINTSSVGEVTFDGCTFQNYTLTALPYDRDPSLLAADPTLARNTKALFFIKTSSAVPALTLRNCTFNTVVNNRYSNTSVERGYGIIHNDNNDATTANGSNGTIILEGCPLYMENCRFVNCGSAGDIVTVKTDKSRITNCVFENCTPANAVDSNSESAVLGLGFSTFTLTLNGTPKTFTCTGTVAVENTTINGSGNYDTSLKTGYHLKGGNAVFKNTVAHKVAAGFALKGTCMLLKCAVSVCVDGIVTEDPSLNYVMDGLVAYGIKDHVVKMIAPTPMVSASDESYGVVLQNSWVRDCQSVIGLSTGWATPSEHTVDSIIPFQMINSTAVNIGSLVDWNGCILPTKTADAVGVKFEDCTLANIRVLTRNEANSLVTQTILKFLRSIIYKSNSRSSGTTRACYTVSVMDSWYCFSSSTGITIATGCDPLGIDPENGATWPSFNAPLTMPVAPGYDTTIVAYDNAKITELLNAYIPTENSIIPQKPSESKLRYDVLGRPRGVINGLGSHCPILPQGIGNQLVGFARNNKLTTLNMAYYRNTLLSYTDTVNDVVWSYNNTTKKLAKDTTIGIEKYASSALGSNGKLYAIPSNRSEVYWHDPIADSGMNLGVVPGKGTMYTLAVGLVVNGTTVTATVAPKRTIDDTTVTLSDATWTMTNSDSWIHMSPGGVGGEAVQISVDANPTASDRRSTITVAWGQLTLTFTITIAKNSSTVTTSPLSGYSTSNSAWVNSTIYAGAVVAGDVIYAPAKNAKQILKIDTTTNTLTVLSTASVTGAGYYTGGALARDGKLYFAPLDTNKVLVLDPTNDALSVETIVGLTTNGANSTYTDYFCGVMATRDGTIVFVPSSGKDVVLKNHKGYTRVSGILSAVPEAGAWRAPVYHPTVNQIFAMPYNSSKILVLDMNVKFDADHASMFATTIDVGSTTDYNWDSGSATVKSSIVTTKRWSGAAIGVDGNIYAIGPHDMMLVINPLSGGVQQLKAPLMWVSTGGVDRIPTYQLRASTVIAAQTGALYAFPGYGYKVIKIQPSVYDDPILPELSVLLNPYTNRS